MNMIERVARAICAAHGYRDPYIDATWPKYEPHARAAIEAMREPTRAVIKAGVDFAPVALPSMAAAQAPYIMRLKFQQMITAALEENP